jgi:hypothetical protein
MNIKPYNISNKKFIHNHTWIKNQALVYFDDHSNIMILEKWVSVQNQNLKIKNQLKYVVDDNEHHIIA